MMSYCDPFSLVPCLARCSLGRDRDLPEFRRAASSRLEASQGIAHYYAIDAVALGACDTPLVLGRVYFQATAGQDVTEKNSRNCGASEFPAVRDPCFFQSK
jgi:hypothetical protein